MDSCSEEKKSVLSLMVITNIKSSSQNEVPNTLRKNSPENLNEIIDRLLAETKKNTAPTLIKKKTITQSLKKGSTQESTTGKLSWPELVAEPAVDNIIHKRNVLNSTDYDGNSNDTNPILKNNFDPFNKSLEHAGDENVGSNITKPFSSSNVDFNGKQSDRNIMEYSTDSPSSKSNLDGNGNAHNIVGSQYIKSTFADNSNRVSWYNSQEKIEVHGDDNDLPTIFNSRQGFNGNNPLSPINENQKDHGLGVVLKEEIVFEIEDDKPIAKSSPGIHIRMHTTTTKPIMPLYKPKVKEWTENATYVKLSTPRLLSSQSVLGSKTNKTMHNGQKTQKSNSFNVFNHQKIMTSKQPAKQFEDHLKDIRPLQITRRPDDNLKFQMEFKKLNDRINTLQELVNKTFDRKNETHTHNLRTRVQHKDPNLYQEQSEAGLLRTGQPDRNKPILQRISVNRVANNELHTLPPKIYQKIPEPNIPTSRHIISDPLLVRQFPVNDPRLQRRLMLLELANIAKLNHNIRLSPVPVYRRRVILKPIVRIL